MTKFPRAFSLLELVVVLTLIGMLAALVLPAIQAGRETARRQTCLNKMRGLGLALHEFIDEHRVLPGSGTLVRDADGRENSHAWSTYLLPYLYESGERNFYDQEQAWNTGVNRETTSALRSEFLCPTIPFADRRTVDRDQFAAGSTDYVPVAATRMELYFVNDLPQPKAYAGLLDDEVEIAKRVRTRVVKDGLSRTIFLTESAGQPRYYVSPGVPGPAFYNDGVNATVTNGVMRGGAWADPLNRLTYHGVNADGLRGPGDCAMNCSNNKEPFSFHTGAINVVMADGSSRTVSDSTEIGVFAAAMTRDGGEAFDLPAQD
ncbi:MAG: DUF1559 domain-containing protein [Pirellulales bacterium]